MRLQALQPVAVAAVFLVVGALTGCGGDAQPSPTPAAPVTGPSATPGATEADPVARQYPDVLDVALTQRSDTSYDVAVTISSPYDTPERYADGWRVLTADGVELGAHTLLHDHASEQPFTRTQSGLEIPVSVDRIVVEGRDLVYGYGGATVEASVPGR